MVNVLVSKKFVDKCKEHSVAVQKHHKSKGTVNNSYTKYVPTKEQQIQTSFVGKLAECATAIYLNLDCERDIDWGLGRDAGYDLKLCNGQTVDVKSSDHPAARRLIFPVKQIDKLQTAADIFVFAKVYTDRANEEGQPIILQGWVMRDDFIRYHWTAKDLKGLKDGTPYMNETELKNMSEICT